jgi:phosphomannomutase
MIQHDKVNLHYVIYYKGSFGSTTRGSHNTSAMTWIEDTSIQLTNGRTFGYLRKSESPDLITVNGQQYNLRQGRVIMLRDDGTEDQLELFPSLDTARNLQELSKLVAAKRREGKRRGTNDVSSPLRIEY